MRTDALVVRRGWACFASWRWALLALCVISTPAMSFGQQKSAAPAGAAAPGTLDTDYPLHIEPATARGPATGLPTPPSLNTGAPSPDATGVPLGIGNYTVPDLTKRENVSAALQLILLLTVLSLAPAILVMMTCFTRIIIVLSLLRQALGTQQLPPNQVLIGLAMFMTFLVMGPTWNRVNNEALKPYLDGTIGPEAALTAAAGPVRQFMIKQIEKSGNVGDVQLFYHFSGATDELNDWNQVGTTTLIPGFMLSELKTAFLMGFKIYLPFLIIDIVISTILISMGMMMLPPVMISLPFKLLLFVLVDGWHLITFNLMGSFG